MRAPKTIVAAVALTAITGLSVAACGSSSSSSPSSSPTAAATPIVNAATLTGVHTQVALASSFTTALKSLGLTPGVSGKATLDASTGVVTFPITGGNVKYYKPGTVSPYVQGIIHHEGSGITLTAGSTVVTLENFDVNPGTSILSGDVLLNGKVAKSDIPIFFLDGSTLKPATKDAAGDYVLTGTTVKINPDAATLLGQVFKAPGKVPAYLTVGVATITVA